MARTTKKTKGKPVPAGAGARAAAKPRKPAVKLAAKAIAKGAKTSAPRAPARAGKVLAKPRKAAGGAAAATALKAAPKAAIGSAEMTDKLAAFLYDYIDSIDQDRLEEWPEYFEDTCIYKIIPRENVERNLPISLVYCDNKGMLIDRVVSLRKANVYNLHYDRHLVSNVRVLPGKKGEWILRACYAVYQTDLEGESMLFSTGRYDAVITRATSAKPRFREMIVTVDTFAVPNLISTPL